MKLQVRVILLSSSRFCFYVLHLRVHWLYNCTKSECSLSTKNPVKGLSAYWLTVRLPAGNSCFLMLPSSQQTGHRSGSAAEQSVSWEGFQYLFQEHLSRATQGRTALDQTAQSNANGTIVVARCTTYRVFSHYATYKHIKWQSARRERAIVAVTPSTRSNILMPSGCI